MSVYAPDSDRGCLAKRSCQGGDTWLIRYHGRIIYEQSSGMFTQVTSVSRREEGRGLLSSPALPPRHSSLLPPSPLPPFFLSCC